MKWVMMRYFVKEMDEWVMFMMFIYLLEEGFKMVDML